MVVITNTSFNVTRCLELGLGGVNQNHTGGSVFPVERTLRSAQHLYLLDIGKVRNARERARSVNAIDKYGYRGLDAWVVGAITKPANHKIGLHGVLELGYAERRHDRLQVEEVADF